jgi:hypothetical protein
MGIPITAPASGSTLDPDSTAAAGN